MRAYIDLKTNIPELHIDYVELKDGNGVIYNFNPNGTSNWDQEGNRYSAEWRGVDMGESDGSGHLSELPYRCTIIAAGVNFESCPQKPYIRKMKFTVEDDSYEPMLVRSFHIADVMAVMERT